MELLDAIMDRRSIRRFKKQKVDPELITDIVKAAMYAPSAVNRQPWHFVVVDDRKVMDKIIRFHPHAGMLHSASHAVIVCGDEKEQHGEGYWVVDCGAATQNLLLAAHSLGIGSCWVGLHPRMERKEAIRALLGLPGHIQPFAMVALGYPDESRPRPDRFKPGKIRYNHWDASYRDDGRK